MENENKGIWGKILKVVITVLTAISTTFGIQACCLNMKNGDSQIRAAIFAGL